MSYNWLFCSFIFTFLLHLDCYSNIKNKELKILGVANQDINFYNFTQINPIEIFYSKHYQETEDAYRTYSVKEFLYALALHDAFYDNGLLMIYDLNNMDNYYFGYLTKADVQKKIHSIRKSGYPIVYFTTERGFNDPSLFDLSIGFNYTNHPKYFRLPLYHLYFKDKISTTYKRGKCNPNKKYWACMVSSLSSPGILKREEVFHSLSKYKQVVSGGKQLNNIGFIVPRDSKENPTSTIDFMKDCKFVIAYENAEEDGYTTEKLPQAYIAGAIPIYWGNKLFYKDLNKKAVVYRDDFDSDESMLELLKKLDNNDREYCKVWNEPLITKESQSYKFAMKGLKEKYEKFVLPKIQKQR